jgi:hypothetical protein
MQGRRGVKEDRQTSQKDNYELLESRKGGGQDSAIIEYVVLFGYMGSYEPE